MSDARAPVVATAPPLVLLRAGATAFREVPGLRRFMVQGFALTYAIFLVLGAVGAGLAWRWWIAPLGERLAQWSAGQEGVLELVAGLLQALLWVGQIVLFAGALFVALMATLAVMGVWFEMLAERIVAHCRGGVPPQPFRLGTWLAGLGRSLVSSIGLLMLSILALFLGFVPFAGPVLVVLINGFLLGREVRDPYLSVRQALGEDRSTLKAGLGRWTLHVGLLPALLGLVPVAGWLVLPVAIIYLVAGFAWESEQMRKCP